MSRDEKAIVTILDDVCYLIECSDIDIDKKNKMLIAISNIQNQIEGE